MKGYVTVFFTVTTALVLSLILELVHGVMASSVRMKAESAVDTALVSQFAEYERPLWKRYGLIFTDSAYGQDNAGVELSEEHLKSCLNENFDERSPFLLGGNDLCELSAKKVKINGIRLATDNNAVAIIEQANLIMKYLYGPEYVKELKAYLKSVENFELDPGPMLDMAREYENDLERDYEVSDYSGWIPSINKEAPDSLPDVLSEYSFLRKIIEIPESVSKCTLSRGIYAGERKLNTGNLSSDYAPGFTDMLLFKEYVYENTGSYLNPFEESVLEYETEYIISGRNSDIQNLELMAKRMALIRVAANISTLMADSTRMEIIKMVSEGVAALLMVPEISGIIETVIVVGWSYMESIEDLKLLFCGERVPFIKSSDQWISGLFNVAGNANHDEGLSYRDYVRIFLFFTPDDKVIKRFETVLEADIRNIEGYEQFRLDNCYDLIKVKIEMESKKGYKFTAERIKGVNED